MHLLHGEDANFTEDLVFARYHGELSNNFGNLLNRSISMSRKNFENEVPPRGEPGKKEIELYQMFEQETSQIKAWVEQFEPHRALERIAMMSSAVNKYLDEINPGNLPKKRIKTNVSEQYSLRRWMLLHGWSVFWNR